MRQISSKVVYNLGDYDTMNLLQFEVDFNHERDSMKRYAEQYTAEDTQDHEGALKHDTQNYLREVRQDKRGRKYEEGRVGKKTRNYREE